MEKYSRWRDAGTGIMPFIPPKGPKVPQSALSFVWHVLTKGIIGPLLSIPKLIMVAVVLIWLIITQGISYLIPIALIRRGFRSYTECLGSRALLLLIGYWNIFAQRCSLSRGAGKKMATRQSVWPLGSDIRSGDIIVFNHTSYVELLYLSFRFAPIFTYLPNVWVDSPPKAVARPITLLRSLWRCVHSPPTDESECVPLKQIISDARRHGSGPIAVCPEGTTSNGMSLLAFAPVLEDIDPSVRVMLVGFRHNYESFSPSYTAGNWCAHLFWLCAQFYNSMSVLYLEPCETPKISDDSNFTDSVSLAMANMLRLRRTHLTSKDKLGFLQYWNKTNVHGYGKSKK